MGELERVLRLILWILADSENRYDILPARATLQYDYRMSRRIDACIREKLDRALLHMHRVWRFVDWQLHGQDA